MAAIVSVPKDLSHLETKDDARVASIELAVSESGSEPDSDPVPRTVDELIKLRARQNGCDAPIVAYPKEGADYVNYTLKDLNALVDRAAAHYASLIPQRVSSDDPVQVVGVLGSSDLSYLVTFLAISRLGHAAFLLSTRITPEAYESLLLGTKATALLYHDGFHDIAIAAQAKIEHLKTGYICDPATLPQTLELDSSYLDYDRETRNISFIIHSSGSTGLPKPIFQTHSASLYAYSQHFNLVGHVTLPLYHNHGICCFFRAIYSRKKIYIYNARLPLTSRNLLSTLSQHPDIRILYGVPYALQLLSESNEGIELLSRLDIVMFGGSACPKPLGDLLVSNSVNLVGHYGATEVGQLMTSFRDRENDKGWDWLRVPPHLEPHLSMESRGPNIYELCVRAGWPSKVATNRDDGSYATKDLFEPHPSIPNAWKYYARLDDTITLENGEKANPLLIEGVLRQNKDVAEAVVFGVGKARLGAFVIQSDTSKLSKNELLDVIMPAVTEMNHSAPAYSQLCRDMIQILPSDVPYQRTDKGTVIRAAFYRDFATKIDDAYIDKAQGTLVLSHADLVDFLRNEISSRLRLSDESKFASNTDLFSMGVDSLQAIQIRSHLLKNLKLSTESVGRNFVFDFPTIDTMADEIVRLQHGGPERVKSTVEERMAKMIDKYAVFETHVPRWNENAGKFIVVTGVTGSLGAHVVSKLASQRSVRKIYCLARASNLSQAHDRLRSSLRERYVYHTMTLAERSKILALPSDLSDANLGLQHSQYDEIAENITHLFHFAWSVNFNKSIESFEGDCIAGQQNLINLCLKARRPKPATFNFCSSVSATARTPGRLVIECLPESLSYAQDMGYAQSKLVAEHLCDRAAKQTDIEARVLRVGQIIGDTRHGIWNDTEAIPMIFQTARTIGALPELDETPAWLPVDVVANTCIEISCSMAPSGVYNVVNHSTFHWNQELLPLLRSSGLEFEAVHQREWIKRLRMSNPDPSKNPPIKLVDFFAGKYDNDNPKRSSAHATENAQAYSLSLQNARAIDAELIQKIVSKLKQSWDVTAQQAPVAFIIGGPCGSGKSTISAALSEHFSFSTIEGDDMHSIASRQQMESGLPLKDSDRLSWLAHVRGAIMDRLCSQSQRAVFVTCSVLKKSYRDEMRALEKIANVRTVFIMLSTDRRQELKARLDRRVGHYMSSSMVDTQVDTFEPTADDEVDLIEIDAGRAPKDVFEEARGIVQDTLN